MTTERTPPWHADSRYVRTGDLLIDVLNRRATCGGANVDLPQRLFDLLLVFMAEPNTRHGRAELFARLWPGSVVEEGALTQAIWLLRQTLGEQRKDWIRTIPKGGYMFEPPEPVEWLAEPPALADVPKHSADSIEAEPSQSVIDAPIDPIPQPTAAPPAALTRPRGRWTRTLGWAAAALATATVALFMWPSSNKEIPVTAPAPLTVALIEVEDVANGSRWPVALSHDWLVWKLGSLPEVTLLNEAELAADTSATAPTMVFLSAGSDPENSSKVLLRARIQGASGEQRIEMRGAVDEVPDMADKLSREVVKRLSPGRAEPWPAMQLNATAARRYADLAAAMERRDWIEAAGISEEVVKLAPRFGLARLQQAKARAELSQATSAIESMDKAFTLLQPAPADVIAVLDAQRLAIDPNPQSQRKAVAAYAGLVARHPANSAIALDYADLLLRTLDGVQALKVLTSRLWDRESTGIRIQRLLLLSQAHYASGDAERAVQSAQAAERLAHTAGEHWKLERAGAMMLAVWYYRGPDKERRVALFEQAAELFEEGGNRTAALHARFEAETLGAPTPDSMQRIDTLLAQAHAGGYRSLEMRILKITSSRYRRAGDIDNYLTYLLKALAVAETSGDIARRNLYEFDVVHEDLVRLRYASAHQRIQRLKGAGLEGKAASIVQRLEAALDTLRGHHARSRNILETGERQITDLQSSTDRVTQAQSELACEKIENDLALGDLAGARADGKRCSASMDPTFKSYAKLTSVSTELLAGDMATAREQLPHARAAVLALPDEPVRWTYTTLLGSLLTRTGDIADSDQLYKELLPKLRRWGYSLPIAQVETGLAENAAARGDWTNALAHVAAARRDLPADDWLVRYRLDVVDTAAALAKGDTARAMSIATQTHAQAHQLGDVVAQMQIHSLMPTGAFSDYPQANETIVARSGMRGATLDWLKPARTGNIASQR